MRLMKRLLGWLPWVDAEDARDESLLLHMSPEAQERAAAAMRELGERMQKILHPDGRPRTHNCRCVVNLTTVGEQAAAEAQEAVADASDKASLRRAQSRLDHQEDLIAVLQKRVNTLGVRDWTARQEAALAAAEVACADPPYRIISRANLREGGRSWWVAKRMPMPVAPPQTKHGADWTADVPPVEFHYVVVNNDPLPGRRRAEALLRCLLTGCADEEVYAYGAEGDPL